jgi:hypothetical protein
MVTPMAQACGDGGDETLRHYLSRSRLVVAGEVGTEPHVITKEAGVTSYLFEFRGSQLLAGPAAGPEISVKDVRHERAPDDAPPQLKRGGNRILFLNPASPNRRAISPIPPPLCRSFFRREASLLKRGDMVQGPKAASDST